MPPDAPCIARPTSVFLRVGSTLRACTWRKSFLAKSCAWLGASWPPAGGPWVWGRGGPWRGPPPSSRRSRWYCAGFARSAGPRPPSLLHPWSILGGGRPCPVSPLPSPVRRRRRRGSRGRSGSSRSSRGGGGGGRTGRRRR